MRMAIQAPFVTAALLLWVVVNDGVVHGFVPAASSRTTELVRVPVSQSAVLISMAELDTMTLNWIGLAVGTMASLWVYQSDQQIQETVDVPSQEQQPVFAAVTAPPPAAVPAKTPAVMVPVATKAATAAAAVVVDEVPAAKPVVAKMKETSVYGTVQ
jgi:hypothetical protein